MALTKEQKILLENKIYEILKESDLFEDDFFYEDAPESDNDDDDDKEDSEKGNTIEKFGIKVVADSPDEITDEMWGRLKTILPAIQDSNDDSVNSFNLTRSQIAYELWPQLDKDAARSKLSQKIQGEKSWQVWELNKLANIVSSSVA